ncbi:MAG TPA: hypothetical protein VM847_05380, partial [Tahibacter sp.]|nr:hypothetical protein [Tahibacter sp.]
MLLPVAVLAVPRDAAPRRVAKSVRHRCRRVVYGTEHGDGQQHRPAAKDPESVESFAQRDTRLLA